jgi:hypothetical protein
VGWLTGMHGFELRRKTWDDEIVDLIANLLTR